MSKQPWMKFFPADWRADPALRTCSLAARGLWIEMLSIMHEANPRGDLVINGRAVTARQLAALSGSTEALVVELLAELGQAAVYSKRKNGVIYSRRIERDENRARKLRENGKMGGNPSLCKRSQNEALDNQPDNTHIPEARCQKPEKNSLGASAPREPAPPDRFEEFWQAYPKREGANPKKPARIRFDQLVRRGHDADAIVAAARKLAAQHPKPTRFVPQAITWLSQERYADENVVQLPRPAAAEQWGKRLEHARRTRRWPVDQWGPLPNSPGCLAPPDLVEDTDGEGWEERRDAA
ncbi:hypothetical protein [Aurantimonas sp. 22II-16-19i]|uniref:hypothetical protein n=1 Tax=Aurantimonas sp. 22II-16-19i TaxID=1317114 RepID=UPI0009F7BCB8|nr:hypothetical protein [Aurantimonas sp. 22II-16-19i]ORE87719.1 hypothetical protein ATO4_25233 [Aurantimonas sp. 22II-16-19i]